MNAMFDTTNTGAKLTAGKIAKKKILLVDDDTVLRQMMVRLLTGEGYCVRTAANGNKAVEMANATNFDLVLLDLTMPGKDGWETFEQLSTQHPALPVILITARSNQVFSAMAAGVGALLEKPLDFEKLFSTMHRLVEEPEEARLARLMGRASVFRYFPSSAGEPVKNIEPCYK